MDKKQTRDARYQRISPLLKKAREAYKEGVLLSMPSIQGGFHFYELPIIESLENTARNRKEIVFDKVEAEHGQQGLEDLFMQCLGHVMNQTMTAHTWEEQADILWFIFNYFSNVIDKQHEQNNTNKCIEIFEEDKIVFIDFQLMEVPMKHQNQFSTTVH